MANYVIYTNPDKTELRLKIDADRAVELEERFGASIQKKLAETDKLSVASEFIAAAIPDLDYAARKKAALEIYDEMVEAGKNYRDYLALIDKILIAGGFMDAAVIERQMKMQAAEQELNELIYQNRMTRIETEMNAVKQEISAPAGPIQN